MASFTQLPSVPFVEHFGVCTVLCIPRTRISLDSVVYAFRQGSSPESIREDFEGLSLSHVYGAIAYYLDNQADLDRYLAARKEQWLELERLGTPPSEDLQARLESARCQATSRL